MANTGSQWTIDTVLQHCLSLRDADLSLYTSNRVSDQLRNEQRFIAQEKAVEAALSSAKTATEKAEFAAERRFDSVNEFRAALSTQQATYISRSEVYTLMALACAIASALGGLVGHYIK